MKYRRFVRAGIGTALVLAATIAGSTAVSANTPVTLTASPNFIELCAPDTKGMTTLTWNVRGLTNDSAILQGDSGTGVWQSLGQVADMNSAPAQVFYTGQPNFFRLHDPSSGAKYSTIEVNLQQNKCGGGGGSSSVTLPPSKFLSTYKGYNHQSGDVWCVMSLPAFGLKPTFDVQTLGSRLAVGFLHGFASGNDPLPCSAQTDEFYRGGVGFDNTAINTFINNHGLTSASLKFRQDTGTQSCIDHIGTNSDPAWDSMLPGSIDVLPDGSPTMSPLMAAIPGGGFWGKADVSAPLGFSLLFNGGSINPHLHFVFVGTDEAIFAQDNVACESTLSMLVLQLNGDH